MADKQTARKNEKGEGSAPAKADLHASPVKPATRKTTDKPASTAKAAAKPVPAKAKAETKQKRAGKYTPELMETIFTRISGGEPLRQICRDLKLHWATVYDWLNDDDDLKRRFTHAREKGEEAIAQECLDIADNATNDWMELHGKDGAELYKLNGEHVQRSKLRIETRLKLLAKWNPKKWGEKVDLNHGVQPENPLASMLQRIAGTGLPVIKGDEE